MPTIYSYQKFIDALRTVELRLPEDPSTHQPIGTELCTIDGTTYVSLPDGVSLPADQPPEIGTPEAVTLTAALTDQIKAASPHVRLIDQRVRDQIRAKYSLEDELKLLRLGPSTDFTTYTNYIESCRSWGAQQREALGL
ncbi:MAG: hypothetical protein ACYDBH_00470 [Acidobacteriaceae bacterium]